MVAEAPPQPVHHGHCHTHHCWHRVSVRRHIAWAWRFFKAHPMPQCTWDGESAQRGARISAYSPVRYRARNPTSTAGGKYQILYSTWLAVGGKPYGNAAYAPPLEQEKIARRVLAEGGITQWANC